MATEISPLLQNYLEGLTDPKTKAALIKELTGNPAPTLEEIRQAMQRVMEHPGDKELSPEGKAFAAALREAQERLPKDPEGRRIAKEADKQRLLGRLKVLGQIPARKLTFEQLGEMRRVNEALTLRHPEVT